MQLGETFLGDEMITLTEKCKCEGIYSRRKLKM